MGWRQKFILNPNAQRNVSLKLSGSQDKSKFMHRFTRFTHTPPELLVWLRLWCFSSYDTLASNLKKKLTNLQRWTITLINFREHSYREENYTIFAKKFRDILSLTWRLIPFSHRKQNWYVTIIWRQIVFRVYLP